MCCSGRRPPAQSGQTTLRLALIDNYDSYTHNLAHLLAVANANQPPETFLSDSYPTLDQLTKSHGEFDAFILSPGPGNPTATSDFSTLQRQILSSSHPVFAVCLGHQALCHLYGASIQCLPSAPAHGLLSRIFLSSAAQQCPLFDAIPSAFTAVRYHSLVATSYNLQTDLIPTAWTVDSDSRAHKHRLLMAVAHRSAPHFGLQFHPESICTEYGTRLAFNFLSIASRMRHLRNVPRSFPSHPPHPTPPSEKLTTFATLVHTSHVRHARPFAVFSKLFANSEAPFWLDSSTADVATTQVSPPYSTADADREPADLNPAHGSARFSIMGACDGPLSELITYNVTDRLVTIRRPRSNTMCKPQVTQWHGCLFDYLKQQLAKRYAPAPAHLPCEMNGGYVGYLGYELKRDVLGVKQNQHTSSLPDAWLVFADRLLLFDHLQGQVHLVAVYRQSDESERRAAELWFDRTEDQLTKIVQLNDGASDDLITDSRSITLHERDVSPLKFTPERYRSEYLLDIEQSQRAIHVGDTYEVCLTNRLRTKIPGEQPVDALQLYGKLRKLNAAPYSAFLQLSDGEAVCCTSPERFLTIGADSSVESKPIKGTRSRGGSFEEDELLRTELQHSKKDRTENLMIVDLVRNDLSRTCTIGSVQVPKLMHVESYATVHQLVSNVTGCLRKDRDVVDCIRAAYPMGSMTGAPKIRTMQIIDSLERSSRGVYSGTIGYLSLCGAADLNVVIRTAVVRNDSVDIGVGGAIIAMSSPEDEYDEAILKGSAIMEAIALHSTGCSDAYFVEHERPKDN